MQQIAHIVSPEGATIRILVRQTKYGIKAKIRKSGNLGTFLQAESEHLVDRPDILPRLIAGEVVYF